MISENIVHIKKGQMLPENNHLICFTITKYKPCYTQKDKVIQTRQERFFISKIIYSLTNWYIHSKIMNCSHFEELCKNDTK